MTEFLKKEITWDKFELLIDCEIFPKEIILKAAYNFLDKWYFFFKFDENKNIILQFSRKDSVEEKVENIIGNYYDELLNTYLRDILEKDNKVIREAIVVAALWNSIDTKNFVSLDTNNQIQNNNQIDFDKDIEEILREIENDPDLKIDEAEIERILKEIEEESETEIKKLSQKEITLDPKNVKDAKKRFQAWE